MERAPEGRSDGAEYYEEILRPAESPEEDDALSSDLSDDEDEIPVEGTETQPGPGTSQDVWAYLRTCKELDIVPVSRIVERSDGETLFLAHYGLGAKGAQALAECLKQNKSIQTINLGDNSLCENGSVQIAEALKENKSILAIDLGGNKISGKGGTAIAEVINSPSCRVMELSLKGNRLGEREAPKLFEAMAQNQRLTAVDLSSNRFGERAGKAIGEALAKNTSLIDVDLSWNNIRRGGAVELCNGIQQNISVKRMSLAWNSLGDDGGAALGEALAQNQCLRVLDVSNNRIGIESAKGIAEGIRKNCGALLDLSLAGNPIEEDGARLILEAVKENKYITSLNLVDTRAKEETLKELEEILSPRQAAFFAQRMAQAQASAQGAAAAAEQVGRSNTFVTQSVDLAARPPA